MGIISRLGPAWASGVVCALVLTGCGGADLDEPAPDGADRARGGQAPPSAEGDRGRRPRADRAQTAAPAPRPETGRVAAPYAEAVAMLRRAPERTAGYDRDLFVHWIDADGDGCDTRDEVLLTEAVRAPRVVGACDLVGGRWRSPYDGVRTGDPSTFDIDHLVPLAESWASGARRWSAARKEAFANDQGDRRSLVAVTASSNRSKSDRDPAAWLPDLGRCRYLRDWVAVKLRWDLAVDRTERSALVRAACRGRVAVRLVAGGAGPASDDGVRTRPRPSPPRRTPAPDPAGGTDPRFDTCGEANAAGLGDYVRGADPEYGWYDDRDGDGTVCET